MTKILLCAAIAFCGGLSLHAEDLSLIGIDHLDLIGQAPVIPPADQRPTPSGKEDPERIASAPNARGDILFCYRRKDILNDALALLAPRNGRSTPKN